LTQKTVRKLELAYFALVHFVIETVQKHQVVFLVHRVLLMFLFIFLSWKIFVFI